MNVFRCLFAPVLIALAVGCGAPQPPLGPPPPSRLDDNVAVTFRIDVIEGGEVAGHGSGTVISPTGHILTAYHVVDGAEELGITVDGGGPYPFVYRLEVVATDEERDLAVVMIRRHFDKFAVIAEPDDIRAGDEVYSAGYPDGYGQIVNRGTIAKRDYSDEDVEGVMLLDLGIAPGDSGGGVFSTRTGAVVGIVNAVMGQRVGPILMIHAISVPAEQIRGFLDKNHVPYVSLD